MKHVKSTRMETKPSEQNGEPFRGLVGYLRATFEPFWPGKTSSTALEKWRMKINFEEKNSKL